MNTGWPVRHCCTLQRVTLTASATSRSLSPVMRASIAFSCSVVKGFGLNPRAAGFCWKLLAFMVPSDYGDADHTDHCQTLATPTRSRRLIASGSVAPLALGHRVA